MPLLRLRDITVATTPRQRNSVPRKDSLKLKAIMATMVDMVAMPKQKLLLSEHRSDITSTA
jgi:hypothetical protein